jgi:hypothetical protein
MYANQINIVLTFDFDIGAFFAIGDLTFPLETGVLLLGRTERPKSHK